jgi:hypothetical protein
MAALETEVAAYLESHRDECDDDGHALVVRNGKERTRRVTVGGTILVSATVGFSHPGRPTTIARRRNERPRDFRSFAPAADRSASCSSSDIERLTATQPKKKEKRAWNGEWNCEERRVRWPPS